MNSNGKKKDFGKKKTTRTCSKFVSKKWQLLHTTLQPWPPDGFQTQICGVAQ
jgi:hypothetical protein